MATALRVCAFDIETDGPAGKFRSGAIWDDEGGRFFEDQANFVSGMRLNALRGYTFYAHNAEYDIIHGLWEAGEDVTMHFYDQTFNRGAWRFGKGKKCAEIRDSMSLAAGQSLATVGKAIGRAKFPTPQKLQGLEPDRYGWICEAHSVGECIECYNLRDAEIVYLFVREFQEWMESMGLQLKRTLGSNAVQLWHYFDPGKQQQLKGRLVMDMARQALHGGRVEAFMLGEIDGLYTYDVRRHYAAIMLSAVMPDCRGLTYVENPENVPLADVEGVVDVTCYVPYMHVPPLPVKAKDGGIYYPCGRFRACFVITELRAAIMRGVTVEKIHRIAYSRKRIKPFEITTLALVNLRNEWEAKGNPKAFLAKVALYSIYGRLGVRDDQEYRTYARFSRALTERDIEGKSVHWIGDLRYVIGEYRVRMRSKIQNALWAATIAAYGRVRLLNHLEAAGMDLAYCDTDSIFSRRPLADLSLEVGGLRDTGHFQHAQVFGPKLYRLDEGDTPEKQVARGIPKQLALRFLENGDVSFPSTLSVLQAVQAQKPAGSWITLVRRRNTVITRRTLDNVAAMRKGGGYSTTRPVTFYLEPSEADFAYLPYNVNPNRLDRTGR